jgi:two-component system chemotaxis sensor kinase CheA
MAEDRYKYFRVEARELVDQLGRGALVLEQGNVGSGQVAQLLRLAHTLKGAARVVKQDEIADDAHAIEEALAEYRETAGAVPRERIDAVLGKLDRIAQQVSLLDPPAEAASPAPGRPRVEETVRTVRADVADLDKLIEGISQVHVQIAALKRSAGSVEQAQDLLQLLNARFATPQALRRSVSGEKSRELAEELGTLIGVVDRVLGQAVEQIDRELRQTRSIAERMRLVAVDAVFGPLERAVRDTAQAQGKRAGFSRRGGGVRIDADVLDAVQVALLQLVVNAVAHGLEPEAERIATGKSPAGRVSLHVERRGRRVAFVVSDDGRGFDLEAVRRHAIEKGLKTADAQRYGADELLGLLIKGGISTSGSVTKISGRGLGLDLVRETAERLNGAISLNSRPGGGATVELSIPVSATALKALIVEAAGMTSSIPLDALRTTINVAPDAIARNAAGDTILFDGTAIPFAALREILFKKATPKAAERKWPTLVVTGAAGVAAIAVDRILGTADVVLRPLPALAPADPTVAGVSLDSEGTPRFVLDPEGLVAAARGAAGIARRAEAARPAILVVDDSLTTRMLERAILESAGYEVDVATSGEEGLEYARRKRYALFLVDVEMPGIDGFTFIERTRADPALRDTPAILVTSRASADDRKRGEDVGARGYVVKSEFHQGNLLQRIEGLVA